MARTRPGNKRQTQLGFTPLSSSSPAARDQPDAVRERAAAITITDSPSPAKRRKTIRHYLPTPSTSSQAPGVSPLRTTTRASFMASQSAGSTVSKSHNIRTHRPELDEFDDSESDTPVMQSSPTRKARSAVPTKRGRDTAVQVLSSSEDDMPRSSGRMKTVVSSNSDSDSATNNSPSHRSTSPEDEDEDEDVLPARKTRRLRRPSPQTPPKARDEQDQVDLDEDLDFLGEADTESPRALRRSGSTKKTAKQQALEALKQRRLSRADESGGHQLSSNGQEDEQSDDVASVDDDLHPEIAEQGESDFIVEDDSDEALGGPVELPFQFSHHRTMKPKELFKFVVEWMVQKKINPAFEMRDEVYQNAFDRLNDLVAGMGGSKFHSSAWTPLFSRMLKSRPRLVDHQFVNETFLRDHCDACNRSGHPATWEVKFTGQTYDRNTLEEDSEEDSDDEDDEDAEQNTVFYIGKFCMRNARTAHQLAHWKYHLKEWVVDYLKSKGELKSRKIVKRDGWSTSKRRKDALRIVDEMEQKGEIQRLYKDFSSEIKEAHYTEHYSGRDMSSP